MSLESAITSSIRVSPRTRCGNVTCPAAREKNNNLPATGPAVTKQSKQKRTAKMILQLRALGYRIETPNPQPSQAQARSFSTLRLQRRARSGQTRSRHEHVWSRGVARRSSCSFSETSIDNKAGGAQTTPYATGYSLPLSVLSVSVDDTSTGSCWGSRHQDCEGRQLD